MSEFINLVSSLNIDKTNIKSIELNENSTVIVCDKSGVKFYYKNDKLHNDEGPAVFHGKNNVSNEWWLNGDSYYRSRTICSQRI